jgi:hypothetical protein
MPRLDEMPRHGLSHDAETDKSNILSHLNDSDALV